MTRFSRIFFGLLVAVLLVWQLPWGVNYLMVKSEGTPFTLYSEVLGDFAMIRRGGKELEYLDRRGNRYGQRQFDSLLPLFYARQLVADGRFPDSIAGRARRRPPPSCSAPRRRMSIPRFPASASCWSRCRVASIWRCPTMPSA